MSTNTEKNTETEIMTPVQLAKARVLAIQDKITKYYKWGWLEDVKKYENEFKKDKQELENLESQPKETFVVPSKDEEFLIAELNKAREWLKSRPIYVIDYQETWKLIYNLEYRLSQINK